MFSDDEIERYARHIVLKDIGGEGQKRLKSASIALIGVGGIGSPAALYLAAAGVGRIGLIDDDVVSLPNLQRQILFTTHDVHKPKVEAARHQARPTAPCSRAMAVSSMSMAAASPRVRSSSATRPMIRISRVQSAG